MFKRFLSTALLFHSYVQATEAFTEEIFPKEEVTLMEDASTTGKASTEEILQKEEVTVVEDVPTTDNASTIKKVNLPILEFRVSYFRPFSKTLRKLTGEGAVYGLEATIPLYRGWNVWAAVDYYSKNGTMQGIHRSVHITMVPITLGLKYFYYFNRFYGLYAGGGGKYYFVEEINRVFPMHKTTHRNGLGGVMEIGNVFCMKDFVIDIFSSWSFKKIDGPNQLPPNATSFSFQVGGWNIGMGLGYKF